MKTICTIFLNTIWVIFIFFFTSCQKESPDRTDDQYKLPKFNFVSEKNIKDNLEMPSGLSNSLNSDYLHIKSMSSDFNIMGIFAEGPTFQNLWSNGGFQKFKNPIISKISGNLNNLAMIPIAEISLEKYSTDFDSFIYWPLPDSLWRPRGLTLDGLILRNGMTLLSSNSSDKIFNINISGEIEIFIQNEMLLGITDMIETEDGKIFAVQAPIFDNSNPSLMICPKRVISIENGIINVEFDLPTEISSYENILYNSNDYPNWFKEAQLREKLKIIENSDLGKEKFKTRFYIADLLGDVIYKVDDEDNLSILAKNLRYPTSLAIDSLGNIFYTNSYLWGMADADWKSIDYPAELNALNPESGQSVLISKFGSSNIYDYYSSMDENIGLNYMSIRGNMDLHLLPLGYNVTNIILENSGEINFLISDSNMGIIKLIKFNREAF
jgi:hypothetical protein